MQPQGLFAGRVPWVLEYGFTEHNRYITAVEYESTTDSVTQAWRYKQALATALTQLGLPVRTEQQDYRMLLQRQHRAGW